MAVDRDFGGRDGGEKETDFIDCVAWRQTGEFVSKYFTKGSMIVVSGRLQIRNWTDKEGNKRRSAEIVADNVYFGESKRGNEGTSNYSSYGNSNGSGYNSNPAPALQLRRRIFPLRPLLPHPISRCWRTTTLNYPSKLH